MEKLVEELWKELQGLDKDVQLAKLQEFAEGIYADGFHDGYHDEDELEEDDNTH